MKSPYFMFYLFPHNGITVIVADFRIYYPHLLIHPTANNDVLLVGGEGHESKVEMELHK